VSAVVLAFFRIGGRETAFVALTWVLLFASFVWALCWIASNTRRRVRLLIVMAAALLGTAAAGSFCVYYHRIDIEKVHLLDPGKLMSAQTTLFGGWSLVGGLGGAIAGAVWSWRATRMAVGGERVACNDMVEQQSYETEGGERKE
jgi:hypothetical protein